MPTLSDYTNVYDVAIEIILEQGFQVWYDREEQLFYCERDGWDFAAESPSALLGIVSVYSFIQPDTYCESWWKRPTRLKHSRLPSFPKPYRAVWDKRS